MTLSDLVTAVGTADNLAIQREWAQAVLANKPTPPLTNYWDSSHMSCGEQLRRIQAGAMLLPTFRFYPFQDSDDWDNAPAPVDPDPNNPNGHTGFTRGIKELAAYCVTHKLPICIRIGNMDHDVAATQLSQPYNSSPFYWDADYSGNTYLGELTIAGGSTHTITSPAGARFGDFYKITISGGTGITATFGSTNGITVKTSDRLIAQTPSSDPSGTDGSDWLVNAPLLGAMTPTSAWQALADEWDTTFFDRMFTNMPTPPLVVLMVNNEYGATIIPETYHTASDHRFTTAHGSKSAVGQRMEYRQEFRSRIKAMWARFISHMPSAWQSVLRCQPYQTCGGQRMKGFRAFPFTSHDERPYDDTGETDTEYGIDWDQYGGTQSGGNAELYYGDTQELGADCTLRSKALMHGVWLGALSDRYAKAKQENFLLGTSVFMRWEGSGGRSIALNFLDPGHGYLSPQRHAALVRYTAMLGSKIHSQFQNHHTSLFQKSMTEADEAAYGITSHEIREYYDATEAAVRSLWENSSVRRGLGWQLEANRSAALADPWDSNSFLGPFANRRGIFAFLQNTYFDISTADLDTEPTITMCRRDGLGGGLIFAWDPKHGPRSVTVETIDGPKTVTATVEGSFTQY